MNVADASAIVSGPLRRLLEPGQPVPSRDHGLLQRVHCVVRRTKHPVAVRLELAAMSGHEPLEGGLVPGLGSGERAHMVHDGTGPPGTGPDRAVCAGDGSLSSDRAGVCDPGGR